MNEQQPQFPLPWNNLALALFQSADFDDDLASVCRFGHDLQSENPQFVSLLQHLTAYVAARQGRWDGAVERWEKSGHPTADQNLDAIEGKISHAPFSHHIVHWRVG